MTEDELQAFARDEGWTEDDIQGYREQLADLAAERHEEQYRESH